MKNRTKLIRIVTIILLFIAVLFIASVVLIPKAEPFGFISSIVPLPTQTLSSYQKNSFVSNASTKPEPNGIFAQAICLSVDESVLWRQEDFADALTNHIKAQTSIFVDDEIISKNDMFFVDLETLQLVYEDDNVIGSWGGPLSVCFNVSNLTAGTHSAKIQTTTTTNEGQSYVWTFKVE